MALFSLESLAVCVAAGGCLDGKQVTLFYFTHLSQERKVRTKGCLALNPRSRPLGRVRFLHPHPPRELTLLSDGAAGILGQEGRAGLRKGRELDQGEGAKPIREYPSSDTGSSPARCSRALPWVSPPSSPSHPPPSAPTHPSHTMLPTCEASEDLLGKAGCAHHLGDSSRYPRHWEFECCCPQETDAWQGLGAQSNTLKNSVV